MAAWYVVVLMGLRPGGEEGEAFGILASATLFIGPPVVVLLGLLGTRRKYSTASRIGAVVPVLIGGLGFGFIWLMSTLFDQG